MKTIAVSAVTGADLTAAIVVVTNGEQCTIYYRGDTLPVAPAPTLEQQQAAVLAQYDAALTAHYDRTAAARNYDSYVTVTMRAGYAGPFQAEALAFAQWMDRCNVAGYLLIEDVKAGRKKLPTIEAFIASLPPLVWPEPV